MVPLSPIFKFVLKGCKIFIKWVFIYKIMQFYPIIAFIYLTSPQIPVLSNVAMRYSIEQRHKEDISIEDSQHGRHCYRFFPKLSRDQNYSEIGERDLKFYLQLISHVYWKSLWQIGNSGRLILIHKHLDHLNNHQLKQKYSSLCRFLIFYVYFLSKCRLLKQSAGLTFVQDQELAISAHRCVQSSNGFKNRKVVLGEEVSTAQTFQAPVQWQSGEQIIAKFLLKVKH